MSLKLFSLFHLNLNYSAIEEADRPRVIEKCYWPLLNLINSLELKSGIELTGYTLESINDIDPSWTHEFKRLISKGICELIGSGYAQIIGPLVPAKVTTKNLEIGNNSYEKILEVVPKIALLNEQAFSKSLVDLYKSAGFDNIIMEWDNPFSNNPKWSKEISYLPQRINGINENEIGLIWNKSIEFQKFQRYAHGELELNEILTHLQKHQSNFTRALPVYGNDVEVFDFRPGRYISESNIHIEGEWNRIHNLYEAIKKEVDMEFILPSEVEDLKNEPQANQILEIASASQPIPVKKQDKYNIVRWAVSGRDDFKINTECWKIFDFLENNSKHDSKEWKELCYLWSSDFRTHITDKRWNKYMKRLKTFSRQRNYLETKIRNKETNNYLVKNSKLTITKNGRFLELSNDRYNITFNCYRGLAIERYVDKEVSNNSIFGTISHGYFDDISYSADYYSGHTVFEAPGKHKITDLIAVEPIIENNQNGIEIFANIITPMGPLEKKWSVDQNRGNLIQTIRIDWPESVIGSFRFGYITLMPEAFDQNTLFYSSHNGGNFKEKQSLNIKKNFDHGDNISSLISANQVLGMTNGIMEIGDDKKTINLNCNKSKGSLVGLVSNTKVKNNLFSRLALSLREFDDTSQASPIGPSEIEFEISIS